MGYQEDDRAKEISPGARRWTIKSSDCIILWESLMHIRRCCWESKVWSQARVRKLAKNKAIRRYRPTLLPFLPGDYDGFKALERE